MNSSSTYHLPVQHIVLESHEQAHLETSETLQLQLMLP